MYAVVVFSFYFDTVICRTGYIQNKYIVVSYSAFIWIIREGSPSMTFDTEFGVQVSPAIKFFFYKHLYFKPSINQYT